MKHLMKEISEEFEIESYDGGNLNPKDLPYLQSCIFDEKTTHSTSKGRNFSLVLKYKNPKKYFSLSKVEICTPRGNVSSLGHCVFIFTKDNPFQNLEKFDNCTDQKSFSKILKQIKVSDRREYVEGYFMTLLDNVTEYHVSRNRKAFSDPSQRPKGRFINIKLVQPRGEEMKWISLNSIKFFGEDLSEEELMAEEMVSVDEERLYFFLENEELFHTFRIPLRSKTIKICRSFLATSKYWNDICRHNKTSLEALQYEEIYVDETIIRKMFCGLNDDFYNIDPSDLYEYYRFFELLGMKDFQRCVLSLIEGGLDREVLVSLYLERGLEDPKGPFSTALLNLLSKDRFELISKYRDSLEEKTGLLTYLLRHKVRDIHEHEEFKKSSKISNFRDASLQILKKIYTYRELKVFSPSSGKGDHNLLLIPKKESSDNNNNFRVHFEVLCWRSNFFSRMVSFGGVELESILSENQIELQFLTPQTLRSYIYYLYNDCIELLDFHSPSHTETTTTTTTANNNKKDTSKVGFCDQYDILTKLYTHAEMFCEVELMKKILRWVRKNESFVRLGVRKKFIRLYQNFLYHDVYLKLEPLERQVLTISSGLFPRKEKLINMLKKKNECDCEDGKSKLYYKQKNKEEEEEGEVEEEEEEKSKKEKDLDEFQKKEISDWLVDGRNVFEKRVIIGGDKTGYAQWNRRRRRLGWKIEFTVDENGRCYGRSQNEGQWSDDGYKEVNGTLDKDGNLQLICNFVGGSYDGQKNAYVGVIEDKKVFKGKMIQLTVGKINAGSVGAHGEIGGNVIYLDESNSEDSV